MILFNPTSGLLENYEDFSPQDNNYPIINRIDFNETALSKSSANTKRLSWAYNYDVNQQYSFPANSLIFRPIIKRNQNVLGAKIILAQTMLEAVIPINDQIYAFKINYGLCMSKILDIDVSLGLVYADAYSRIEVITSAKQQMYEFDNKFVYKGESELRDEFEIPPNYGLFLYDGSVFQYPPADVYFNNHVIYELNGA